MSDVKQHYERVLGPVYTWMLGGFERAQSDAAALLARLELSQGTGKQAVDLGCGPGAHAVALADAGYRVVAIDQDEALLKELEGRRGDRPIDVVKGDLLDLRAKAPAADLVLCLGDTITHLRSHDDVQKLAREACAALGPGGALVLGYRDTSVALEGDSRFIPVRSDATTVFTCFLEYVSDRVVNVHDLVYRLEGGQWRFACGHYPKLRIAADWLKGVLTSAGFGLRSMETQRGMTTLVAVRG